LIVAATDNVDGLIGHLSTLSQEEIHCGNFGPALAWQELQQGHRFEFEEWWLVQLESLTVQSLLLIGLGHNLD
jgi:hypothetical protein